MRTIALGLFIFLAQAAPTPASLEGLAVRGDTGEKVSKATVVILKIGGGPANAHIATTDAAGKFVIGNIPPGGYSLVATRSGYARFVHGQTTPNGPAGQIEFAPGQQIKELVIKMTPTGVIAGRVFNPDGEPGADVNVRAQKATYRDGQRTITTVKEVPTNDLGEYRLSGLLPGQYFISVLPIQPARVEGNRFFQPTPATSDGTPAGTMTMSFETAVGAGRVDAAVIAGEIYPAVYFPGTIDPALASAVDLRPGATFGGVDLTIVRARAAHIRGRVISSATGQVVTGINVQLSLRGGSRFPTSRTTAVSDAGAFEFSGLLPGSYLLNVFNTPDRDNGLSGQTAVEVGGANVENVTLVTKPYIKIAGRVAIEGRLSSASDADLSRLNVLISGTLRSGGIGTKVGADGTFSITGITAGDTYRVQISGLPATWYIKAARLGSIDALKSGLHLDDAPNGQLDVIVSPNSGTLNALVLDELQKAASNVTVVLVPDHTVRHISNFYRSASTDGAGRIRIEGIAPGDYKLFAWEQIESGAWQDPEIIRVYETRGEPIRIEERGTASVTLKAITPR
jgi:hypothetical protein